MTLEDLWKIARRYWLILLACALVGTGAASVFYLTQPKKYTATTTAYVVAGTQQGGSQSDSQAQAAMAYSNSMLAKQKAQSWLPLFKSTPVAQEVIKKFHLKMAPGALASSVSTNMDQDAPVITVSVQSSTPSKARDIANGVVDATAKQVEQLEGANAGARVQLVSNAALPSSPSYPQATRILPIGFLLGLIIGFIAALVLHRRDTHVRSESDVEESLNSSILASIPENKGLASDGREAESEDFRTREALRQLRTNLRFVDPDNPPRAIIVSSSRMGEGKSSIASNLARVLAESGEKVLLIDADLRRPMVSSILHLEPEVGLSQLITGSVQASDVITPTNHANMFAIPAGQIPPNPSELLGSQSMRRLITALKSEYFVILDAPPLLPVTDAALLMPATDGALIVVDAQNTRKEHLKHMLRNVQAVNGHILGVVLNRVKKSKTGGYGYGYSSDYVYEEYSQNSQSEGSVRKSRRGPRDENASSDTDVAVSGAGQLDSNESGETPPRRYRRSRGNK